MSPNLSYFEKVQEFQTKILNCQGALSPTLMDSQPLDETIACLEEELDEFCEANTVADQADALIDLVYFALGALHKMGVDADRVFDEVHRANMSKVRGMTKRGHECDALKPENWQAPDHSWLDEVA